MSVILWNMSQDMQPYTLTSPTPPDPDLTALAWGPHLLPRVVWLSSD